MLFLSPTTLARDARTRKSVVARHRWCVGQTLCSSSLFSLPSTGESFLYFFRRPFITLLFRGPEPSDQRYRNRDRSPDDGPGRKDRPNEKSGCGDRCNQWPDRGSWKLFDVVRLTVQHLCDQHLTHVTSQPNDNGLIGRLSPQRVAPRDRRYVQEVVTRWRRRCGPLECACVPGIVPGDGAALQAAKDVDEKYEYAECENHAADRCEQVQGSPTGQRLVRVNASRHSFQTENVHREESKIEPDEHQPESELAESFAEHAPGEFRKPVMKCAKQRKHRPANQH